MRKIFVLFLLFAMMLSFAACGTSEEDRANNVEPQISQMKAICELSVMECYYHNVAKYYQENAERGFLGIGRKDKHFWIEYSGIVKLGVDVSLVNVEIDDTQISITIPEAKVLGCKVDTSSLSTDSYIVDKDSADVTAEDEIKAFGEAQAYLQESAAKDRALLANAQQRAMSLLEDYILNIGNIAGKQYSLKWIYIDAEGNPLSTQTDTPITERETTP